MQVTPSAAQPPCNPAQEAWGWTIQLPRSTACARLELRGVLHCGIELAHSSQHGAHRQHALYLHGPRLERKFHRSTQLRTQPQQLVSC